MQYYSQLFISRPSTRGDFIRGHLPCISEDDISMLKSVCTEEEITKTTKNMSPMKSLGPDGYQPIFYQCTWSTTAQSGVAFVKSILNGNPPPEGTSDALLVLVPKIESPSNISQFRPISLCNISYKITKK